MDVYLLPGLGADERLFTRFKLEGRRMKPLEWPDLELGSSLRDVAEVLVEEVDTSVPHALVGVSMGGMVAQELAALSSARQVVIISSWKGPEEMPLALRSLRGTHPERLLTKTLIRSSMPLIRWQMGAEGPEEQALFDALVTSCPLVRLKTQVAACLDWKGCARPERLLHLHGDRDRLMPIDKIEGAEVVPGGTHFMIFTQGAMLADRVNKYLMQRNIDN